MRLLKAQTTPRICAVSESSLFADTSVRIWRTFQNKFKDSSPYVSEHGLLNDDACAINAISHGCQLK